MRINKHKVKQGVSTAELSSKNKLMHKLIIVRRQRNLKTESEWLKI